MKPTKKQIEKVNQVIGPYFSYEEDLDGMMLSWRILIKPQEPEEAYTSQTGFQLIKHASSIMVEEYNTRFGWIVAVGDAYGIDPKTKEPYPFELPPVGTKVFHGHYAGEFISLQKDTEDGTQKLNLKVMTDIEPVGIIPDHLKMETWTPEMLGNMMQQIAE